MQLTPCLLHPLSLFLSRLVFDLFTFSPLFTSIFLCLFLISLHTLTHLSSSSMVKAALSACICSPCAVVYPTVWPRRSLSYRLDAAKHD